MFQNKYIIAPCENVSFSLCELGNKPFSIGAYILLVMIIRKDIIQKTSGIYQIKSIHNNKLYIGNSANVYTRKQKHLRDLKRQKHDNRYLQNHINKYGLTDLHFSVIEFCSIEDLILREQYWIDTLKPEFNICLKANSTLGLKHTKESKQKHAKALLLRISQETEKEKELRIQKCRDIKILSLKRNPEQKQKISDALKKYYKKHPEYRQFQSKYRKGMSAGSKNPMYGKSVYEIWLQKYGKEEADKKAKIAKQKQSASMKLVRSLKKWDNYGKYKKAFQ